MKKFLTSMLILTLSLSVRGVTKASAMDDSLKNDIVVGYVEDKPIPNTLTVSINEEKVYNLDFSCLNVNMKNGKLVTTVNWIYVNIADTKSRTFLGCISSY